MQQARVKRRKLDHDGNPIGKSHTNLILDSREYVVEFPDRSEAEYAANTIAQNMWAQCDMDGNQHLLLDAIVDHKMDSNAVMEADKYIQVRGKNHLRKTTKGWHVCEQWKDGSTTWERLANVKESYPVQLAEYAKSRGIDDEAAFQWWAPYTLRKRDHIIAAVNQRYHKCTHQFGIRIPKTVREALKSIS